MNLKTFLSECSDKDVFKRASIYLVSSWVLIQVLDVTSTPLGLPNYSVTILLIFLIIGFPINMYLVWLLHIKNLGPQIDEKSNEEIVYSYKNNSFKKIYFAVISFMSVIALLLAFTILNNNFIKSIPELVTSNSKNKIAILKFGNNTGNTVYDDIGKMATDWLIHGITENKVGQTVSPKIIEDYTNILKSTDINTQKENVIKKYFRPEKIITGNYFLRNDKLILQGSIVDGYADKILISFKSIECSINNPLECIESLKQLVLGYLITEDNSNELLQETPPVYKAYQLVLEAKANLDDSKKSLQLLNQAIEIDHNYFEPKVLRIANYYNEGLFKEADSLRKLITPTNRNNKRQQNLLNLYESLIEGNNKKIYSTLVSEYNHTPFDLESNQSTMTVALEFVNKPNDVAPIFDQILTDKMALENCVFCEYRIYIKGKADVELQKYDAAINLFKDIPITKNNSYLYQPILIAAYIRSNKLAELTTFEASQKRVVTTAEMNDFYDFAAKEFLLQQNPDLATQYLDKLVQANSTKEESFILAKSYFLLNDFNKATATINKLLQKSPDGLNYISLLAKIQLKQGPKNVPLKLIEQLKTYRAPYQYGEIEYLLASIYSVAGNTKLTLMHLKNSIARGNRYTMTTYQNDPEFLEYFDSESFKEILTYWH